MVNKSKGQNIFERFREPLKNSFLLRTAAISSGGVVRTKFVLDIALAVPAAILTFRQSRGKFRSFS